MMKRSKLTAKQQKALREWIITFCLVGVAVFAAVLFIWPKWGIAGLGLCLLAWDYRRRQLRPVPTWYLAMDGVAAGPYRKQEIEGMAQRGLVQMTTLGCLSGTDAWHPAGHLFPKLQCPGPTSTAVPQQGAPPVRDGCLHGLGMIIMLIGVVLCFTIVGLPLGVPMALVGGVLMIAAK